MRRLGASAGLAAAVVALAGCQDQGEAPDGAGGTGPLVLNDGGPGGGIGDVAPPRRLWDGTGSEASWALTLGGLELCTTDPEGEIDLLGLRARGPVAPVRVSGAVRRMTPGIRRSAPSDASVGPLLGGKGTPPDFAEPYARDGEPLAGDVRPLGDATVTHDCDAQRHSPFDFTELLVSVEAGDGGALATGFELSYRADGSEYVLDVPWEAAMCGDEVDAAVTESCPP